MMLLINGSVNILWKISFRIPWKKITTFYHPWANDNIWFFFMDCIWCILFSDTWSIKPSWSIICGHNGDCHNRFLQIPRQQRVSPLLSNNRNIIVFFSLISHLQAAQVFEGKKCLKLQHSQHALEEENEPQVKRRSGQETDWDSKINVHCQHPPEKVSKLPKTTPLWEALSSICSNQLLLQKQQPKALNWAAASGGRLHYLKNFHIWKFICCCSVPVHKQATSRTAPSRAIY